jgi:hypothetical protein
MLLTYEKPSIHSTYNVLTLYKRKVFTHRSRNGGTNEKPMFPLVKVLALAVVLVLGGCSLLSRWTLHNHSSYTVSVSLLDNSFKDGTTSSSMSPGHDEELKNDSMPSLIYFPANYVSATSDLGGKTVTFKDN